MGLRRSAHLPDVGRWARIGGWTTESVTHGQCDARPTATFLVAERRRPLAGTKLYCLVTEAHGCEQLAQSCYAVADWPGVELAIYRSRANALTTEPQSHPIWIPPLKRAISATVDLSSIRTVADRHRLAAYHNKHCCRRPFRGYQNRWTWAILK